MNTQTSVMTVDSQNTQFNSIFSAEYAKAKKEGFVGTLDEYEQYRDFT